MCEGPGEVTALGVNTRSYDLDDDEGHGRREVDLATCLSEKMGQRRAEVGNGRPGLPAECVGRQSCTSPGRSPASLVTQLQPLLETLFFPSTRSLRWDSTPVIA